jgi:hypothetical protein
VATRDGELEVVRVPVVNVRVVLLSRCLVQTLLVLPWDTSSSEERDVRTVLKMIFLNVPC